MFNVKKELKETLSLVATELSPLDYFRIMTGKISLYYALITELLIDWYYYFENQHGNVDDVDKLVGMQILARVKNIKLENKPLIPNELYIILAKLFKGRDLALHKSAVYILSNQNDDYTDLMRTFLGLYSKFAEAYLELKKIDKTI